nr:phospholipase-like protein [Tanacetum cinerariifolium]
MNSSTYLKLAIEMCMLKKKKYVDVMRSPYSGLSTTLNIPSIEQLANQKNVLNPFTIKKCKSVKPWIENGLCGLDDNRKGWLVDEASNSSHSHYSSMDWAMVSCYFLQLLLQGSMSLLYANSNIYPVAWSNVERVFIQINEPKRHWSLAMFHIRSEIVTLYDSEDTHDFEFRTWLACSVPLAVDDPLQIALAYREKMIRFSSSTRCSVLECCMLAYSVPLAVDDPLQIALAYREKMIRFYFQHKMLCP